MKGAVLLGALVGLLVAVPTGLVAEEPTFDVETYNECVLEKIRTAADETPVSEIRDTCLAEVRRSSIEEPKDAASASTDDDRSTPLDARIAETAATERMRFVITPYKPNYIMVGYNADPNTAPYE